ncbi:hypothetical protein B0H11DRAFT_1899470 [Mycena galericulata]|nr:hypothetical protein B0H11DRAFT_1899470 [Mycena galericulata]
MYKAHAKGNTRKPVNFFWLDSIRRNGLAKPSYGLANRYTMAQARTSPSALASSLAKPKTSFSLYAEGGKPGTLTVSVGEADDIGHTVRGNMEFGGSYFVPVMSEVGILLGCRRRDDSHQNENPGTTRRRNSVPCGPVGDFGRRSRTRDEATIEEDESQIIRDR